MPCDYRQGSVRCGGAGRKRQGKLYPESQKGMAGNLISDSHHAGFVTSRAGRPSRSTGRHCLRETTPLPSPGRFCPFPVHIHTQLQAMLWKEPAQLLMARGIKHIPCSLHGLHQAVFCCYETEVGKFTCTCVCTCEGLALS